jgi:single-strand DNA-binding protein
MANFNKVILIGNLTRDPELRVTPSGTSICRFGLAVNRTYTTQDGERREETTFVDIDSFGKPAEIISKYMAKGRPILVEGRLRLDQWEDKSTGEKRSRLGVVCENFQFLGGRSDSEGSGHEGGSSRASYEDTSPPARGNTAKKPADSGAQKAGDIEEDDVPF